MATMGINIDEADDYSVYQTSTISALLAGVYDGDVTVEQLMSHGDFGLGTFNALDGEMVVLDGSCYHLRSDGSAALARPTEKTPFAAVTRFRGRSVMTISEPTSLAAITAHLDETSGRENATFAVRIDGRFTEIRTRTVGEQSKPYPPLVQAVEDQKTTMLRDHSGSVAGFRTPSYEEAISVAGYHLHFIDEQRTSGGHVLDLIVADGEVSISPISELHLAIPQTEEFLNARIDLDEIAESERIAEGSPDSTDGGAWPTLEVASWTGTRTAFHMWTQIVGKIRMALTPAQNHWWHVPLYVSARGLTTGTIAYEADVVEIEFDLIADVLAVRRSDGRQSHVDLVEMSVADFYSRVEHALTHVGVTVAIHAAPNEVDPAVPFADDVELRPYDPASVRTFWRQLIQAHRVLSAFRAEFDGKASPVHFFWGAMDLAATRFSGRRAPEHPGGVPNCPDHVMVEGYSHEMSSAGFWPGGGVEGAFYSYAYPVPEGYADAPVPAPAFFSAEYGEFLLPYEAVRTASDPDRLVAEFLSATFDAARSLGRWDAA